MKSRLFRLYFAIVCLYVDVSLIGRWNLIYDFFQTVHYLCNFYVNKILHMFTTCHSLLYNQKPCVTFKSSSDTWITLLHCLTVRMKENNTQYKLYTVGCHHYVSNSFYSCWPAVSISFFLLKSYTVQRLVVKWGKRPHYRKTYKCHVLSVQGKHTKKILSHCLVSTAL
jgi:hypothetical protein